MKQTTGNFVLNMATAGTVLLAAGLGFVRLREHLTMGTTAGVVTMSVSDWQWYSKSNFYLGPSRPRVTIVEFSDYQCIYCKRSVPAVKSVRQEFRDEVAFVYRHVPSRASSKTAAVATECAGREGAFESMHDALFANNEAIGTRTWASFAVEAGVKDTVSFLQCLESPSALEAVRIDSIAAKKLGVQGTPTFLINDQVVEGSMDVQQLRELVQKALRDRTRIGKDR
jgi:protein-disulfide isomerase